MSPLVPVNPPHGTNGHNGHGHNGNGHNGNGQSNGVFVPVVSRPQIQRLTDSRCDPDVLDGRTQIFNFIFGNSSIHFPRHYVFCPTVDCPTIFCQTVNCPTNFFPTALTPILAAPPRQPSINTVVCTSLFSIA